MSLAVTTSKSSAVAEGGVCVRPINKSRRREPLAMVSLGFHFKRVAFASHAISTGSALKQADKSDLTSDR